MRSFYIVNDRHDISALDFLDVVGCEPLVHGESHRCGSLLDLLLTDVRGVINVESNAPIIYSDHHSKPCEIQLDLP